MRGASSTDLLATILAPTVLAALVPTACADKKQETRDTFTDMDVLPDGADTVPETLQEPLPDIVGDGKDATGDDPGEDTTHDVFDVADGTDDTRSDAATDPVEEDPHHEEEDDPSFDAPDDGAPDTGPEVADDSYVDTTGDTVEDAADIGDDTSADASSDDVDEEVVTECSLIDGSCVPAGPCTSCPAEMLPTYSSRGCGEGMWCCTPETGGTNECIDAGGTCIPDLFGAECAPGWSLSGLECWGVGTLCCVEDPGC
jgi:hypothetical protein